MCQSAERESEREKERAVNSEALLPCFENVPSFILPSVFFTFLSRLHRERLKEVNRRTMDKSVRRRGGLEACLFIPLQNSTLTWTERVLPSFASQTLPRGTVTSRSGDREKGKQRERERERERKREGERGVGRERGLPRKINSMHQLSA